MTYSTEFLGNKLRLMKAKTRRCDAAYRDCFPFSWHQEIIYCVPNNKVFLSLLYKISIPQLTLMSNQSSLWKVTSRASPSHSYSNFYHLRFQSDQWQHPKETVGSTSFASMHKMQQSNISYPLSVQNRFRMADNIVEDLLFAKFGLYSQETVEKFRISPSTKTNIYAIFVILETKTLTCNFDLLVSHKSTNPNVYHCCGVWGRLWLRASLICDVRGECLRVYMPGY